MTDSNVPEALRDKHERNREDRIAAIKRWVEYIESTDPDVWGEQLNTLVNSQLDAARGADVSAEQYQRVREAGRAYADDREVESSDEC